MEHDAYTKYMGDTDADLAAKATELAYKRSWKTDRQEDLTVAKKNRALDQKTLDAALAYYDKLKPRCVDVASISYDERKKRREDEIQSLTEALKILQGQDITVR